MAFKKVVSIDVEKVYSLGAPNNPNELTGYYLGFKEVTGENGVSKIHAFKTPKGQEGIWGKTESNKLLASVPLGSKTMVKALGKVKIGGGKTKWTFDVQFDDEDNINAGTATAGSPPAFDADESIDAYESETDSNDEDTAQNAALMAAEAAAKKAKLQAILNKNKKPA